MLGIHMKVGQFLYSEFFYINVYAGIAYMIMTYTNHKYNTNIKHDI